MTIKIKTLRQVEALEERLQAVKWTITLPARSRRDNPRLQIVERTAGLLGKTFPSGVVYERRRRQAWDARTRRLGL
jgi:hypothetical protein